MNNKQHHRDVYVSADGPATQVLRIESDAPIDAYDALNAASKHLEEVAPKQTRNLKVYCS